MKTNKKVQKNSVQKSEKENAVKVTALAIKIGRASCRERV